MASEFAETTLGSLLSFSNGRTSPERAEGLPYPVYGSNGIIGRAAGANSSAGSIIIGRVGSYCGSLYLSKEQCWVSDNAIRANALGNNDSRFLFYLLGTLGLNNWRAGSGQPLLNQDILRRIPASVPEPAEQRAIAYILGTLDDKIELNRRMSATLEEMARAIYKSWFIDFDPVHAKAEGRPTGLPPEIDALFPNSYVDSELGPIPRGWIVGTVAAIGPVVCGKTPPTSDRSNYGEDIPFITIPDMHGQLFAVRTSKKLSEKGAASQPKKTVPSGAIAVSCIATPGLVTIVDRPSQTNQQINTVVPSNLQESFYWYHSLSDLANEIRAAGSGGSVLTNLSTGRFSELKVLFPPAPLRLHFHNVASPILLRLLDTYHESHNLVAIRDSLLPKLISGELELGGGIS